MDMWTLRRVASHVMWTEEPDVFCVRFQGQVRGAQLREILGHRNAWCREKRHYFVLSDLSAVGSVDSEGRQVMTEERATVDPRQISVNFGASFGFRVVADMIHRAQRALNPDQGYSERVFVATEADAREFIEKRRT